MFNKINFIAFRDKSRSVRRAEGFGVWFWLNIVQKVEMLVVKMEVLECIVMWFRVRCVMKSRDQRDELKIWGCVFGSSAMRKFKMIAVS